MHKIFKKAFTLVELLVVIAILAVLATVTILGYTQFTKKANISVDTVLVKNMNTALDIEYLLETDKPITAYEAIDSIKDCCPSDKAIKSKTSGYVMAWDAQKNQFVLIDDQNNAVFPEYSGELDRSNLWVILDAHSTAYEESGYNEYIKSGYTGGEITSATGIDVGYNENIDISYVGKLEKAIVRTNGGKLTVNNENAVVYHYGTSSDVEIISCKPSSYHLCAEVNRTFKVKSGRVVIEENGYIKNGEVDGIIEVLADDLSKVKLAYVVWDKGYDVVKGGVSIKSDDTLEIKILNDSGDEIGDGKCVHEYDPNAAQTVVPTCTEDGYTENDCTKCGYHFKGDIVPALGHDISDAWQNDATYHWHGCSRCDGQFNKVEHNYGAWSAGKQTCEICGFEHTCQHTLTQHDAKAATCTEKGWNAYETCSNCGYSTYAEIPATGHAIVNHAAKAATCTEVGWYAYETCSNCDYTTYQEISKTAHSYTVLQQDETYHWHKCATCSATNMKEKHSGGTATCTAKAVCTVCQQAYGSLAPHTYENYQLVSATQVAKYCSTCKTFGAHTNIDTSVHSYQSTKNDVASYMSGNNDRTFANYTLAGIDVPSGSWAGGEYSFTVSKAGTLYLRNNSTERIISKTFTTNPTTVKINSLIPGVVYSYAYIGSDNTLVASGKVKANGQLRLLNVRGYSNFRDIGGLSSAAGSLKYNKIIRGNAVKEAYSECDFILKQLCDISSEVRLGNDQDCVAYLSGDSLHNIYIDYYTAAFNNSGTLASAVKQIITDVNNGKTVYVHCSAGRDRTGTVMLLVEGLLGVSQADMIKDYELTAIAGSVSKENIGSFVELYNYIMAMDGSDFANKIAYWLSKNGVTYEQINAFRKAMCTGTPTTLEAPKTIQQDLGNLMFRARCGIKPVDGAMKTYQAAANGGFLYTTNSTGMQIIDAVDPKITGINVIKIPENAQSITIMDATDDTYYYSFVELNLENNGEWKEVNKTVAWENKNYYNRDGYGKQSDNHSYTYDITGGQYLLIFVGRGTSATDSTKFEWMSCPANQTNTNHKMNVGISAYFTIKQ